tara:strand:- start:576 stop:1007 length:432 start_codon:yes stop_codon:yes gene_type:complete
MLCALLVSTVISGLTYREIPLTPTFTLRAPYLDQNQRSPEGGFLVGMADMAHIQTELKLADSTCEIRLNAMQEAADNYLLETQQRQQERLAGYVARIDQLTLERDSYESLLADEKASSRRFRLITYVTAGILTSTIGYLAFTR